MESFTAALIIPSVDLPILINWCFFARRHFCLAIGLRTAGDIVLFSGASASKLRLGEGAKRATLIELVNDVTGAGKAPVKGGVAAKRSFRSG